MPHGFPLLEEQFNLVKFTKIYLQYSDMRCAVLNCYRSFIRVHKTLPPSPYKSKVKYNVNQAFTIRKTLSNPEEIQKNIQEGHDFTTKLPKLNILLSKIDERVSNNNNK